MNESNGSEKIRGIRPPTPEYPTPEQLRAYGDLMFLYMRIPRYEVIPMKFVRRNIQPPIDLGFHKVFYQEGVPRVAMTWAFLGKDQERKFVSGGGLKPDDWFSGPQLWITDILAPYGRGTGGDALRWLRKTVAEKYKVIRFPRVKDGFQLDRIVESRRQDSGGWAVKSIPVDQFLADLDAPDAVEGERNLN